MILNKQQILYVGMVNGIQPGAWRLADDSYATVSSEYVREVWEAWIESIKLNAPGLLLLLNSGGKTRLVPRWIAEAGDCDDHAILCVAHAITGNWQNAAKGGAKVARSIGFLWYVTREYTGHAIMWYIDHEGRLCFFEPGLGEDVELTQEEKASVSLLYAA